jgi:hypothetical protein
MATQNTVTKIYRLETVGFSDLHNQFSTLSDDLLKIKKLILELQGKSLGLKGDDLAKINSQIAEALNVNDDLEKQMEQMNKTQDQSISKYFQLNQAYQQAKKNAQDLAAEFGVEDERARAAAASAANLKQQLTDINNLIKSAPKGQAPIVPISGGATQPQNVQVITNTADLEKQKELLKETGDEVLQVKTKYEQYTGSLRDNIVAQIDNSNQLARNRDAQKAIQAVINAQGSATQQQIDQLAALRQQELILIETNKQLTVTVRNQTQEFIAGVGAVDQMQAQLNQLQQQYEKLTETERASPFGQQIKQEIDLLLPQVKALEEEQGKFGRNVGNYQGSAKIIVDALKNVETEITNLQQKQQGLVDFSKKNPIGFKLSGGQENLNQVTGELNGLQKQFTALNTITSNPQFLNIAAKVGDNRQEIRFFTNQLAELRKEGLDTSDAFLKIEARLAELTKDTRETRESIKALSSETRSLDLVASGFRSLADGAQLFVGVQALIGGSNEQVQKSLQTLLAVQNVATGARQLANEATTKGTALNKLYNFVLLQTKVLTDANATASAKWTSVLKLGVIGVIIGAIVLLIANMDKLNGKQKELQRGLEDLQGVTDETKDKLKEYGKSIDEVVDGSIKGLEEAIKGVNTELGKTPTAVDAAEASLQLLNNRVDNLTDDLLNNTFTFTKFLQGIGGAQASFATLKGLADAGDKIKVINDQLEKLKRLNLQKELNQGVLSNFQDIIRSSDLQIDANNRLLASDQSTLAQRISALRSNLSERKKIIDADRNIEILNAGKDAQKRKDADKKANADNIKAERDFADQLKKQLDQADKNATENAFKNIDTSRDEQLANENTRQLELKKTHQQSLEGEITYLNNIEKINVDALDAKIKFLTAQKNLNLEELKQLAEFRQQRAEIQLKTVDDIQKATDDEFKSQSQLLRSQLERDIAAVQEQADKIINSPTSSATEKANAKLDADNQILALQQDFNQKMDLLEKQLNQQSLDNTKQGAAAIRKTKEEILKDQLAIANAALSDITSEGEKQRAVLNVDYEKLRQNILTNDKLTATQRANALDKLAKQNNLSLLASQFKQDTIAFDQIQSLYELGLANEETFLKAQEAMEKSHTAFLEAQRKARLQNLALPSSENTQSNLQERLSKAFGFAEGSAQDQLLGNVIASSFSLAQDAMNNYFDAEQARIQQSLTITQQRIDLEKQQAQARAQSQAELDSIEKQAQVKTRNAQRQAGEQLKKVKKSEARVALATELANIAVSAASNPLNGVTFGAAGAIMYGLLAALALARYAINISAIDRQQFKFGGLPGETIITTTNNNFHQKAISFITPRYYNQKFAYGGTINNKTDNFQGKKESILERVKTIFKYSFGGKTGEVPKRGGKFGGKPHDQGGTKFIFKKKEYEAEVEELAIIRTRNADRNKKYTVTGNQMQLASFANLIGGGVNFKPGAKVSNRFATGGVLGSSLQAPVYIPSTVNSSNNDQLLVAMKEQNDLIKQSITTNQVLAKEQSERVDRLQVQLNPQEVTKAQEKTKKQTSVGTIS